MVELPQRKTNTTLILMCVTLFASLMVLGVNALTNNTVYPSDFVNPSYTSITSGLWYSGSTNITDVLNYPVQMASYIIFTNGSNVYAKNCTTGIIDYSGTNASTVIQSVLTNGLTAGRTQKQTVVLKGNYTEGGTWVYVSNNTVLDLRDAVFELSSDLGMYSEIIRINGSNVDIIGGKFIGHLADNAQGCRAISTSSYGLGYQHQNITIRGCYFYDILIGIEAHGRNTLIDGCFFDRTVTYGINNYAGTTEQLVITNCFIYSAGGINFDMSTASATGNNYVDNLIISNCYVDPGSAEDTMGIAFATDTVNVGSKTIKNVIIENTIVKNTDEEQIHVEGSGVYGISISNCIFDHTEDVDNIQFGQNATQLVYGVKLSNVRCLNSGMDGIGGHFGDTATFSNVEVLNASRNGIWLAGEGGAVLTNVVVRDCSLTAASTYNGIILSCRTTLVNPIVTWTGSNFNLWGLKFESGSSGSCIVGGNVTGGYGDLSIADTNIQVIGGTFNTGWHDHIYCGSTGTHIEGNPTGYETLQYLNGANSTPTTFVLAHSIGFSTTPNFVVASFNSSEVTGYAWTANTTHVTLTIAGNQTAFPAFIGAYAEVAYEPP